MTAPRAQHGGSPTRLIASTVAALVCVTGVINILSAWIGISHSRLMLLVELLLRYQLPLEIHHGSRTLTALAGFLLILLSYSLYRRKHRAWLAALTLLLLSTLLHLGKGLDIEEASLSLAAAMVLWATRRQFIVQSDHESYRSALRLCLALMFGILCYGVSGFLMLHRHFTPTVTLARAVHSTTMRIVSTAPPALRPVKVLYTPPRFHLWHRHAKWHRTAHLIPDPSAVWFLDSLTVIAFISVFVLAGTLLRPVAISLRLLNRDREEAARVLAHYGGPPFAYWALLPGRHYLFSADRQAVLAYSVVNGTAIVVGDPLGDPAAIPGLIAEFKRLTQINDWRPVWYQVTATWLPHFTAQGWRAMKIGEDALVDLPDLAFTGKRWQDVRSSMNQLPTQGYAAVWYDLHKDPDGLLPGLAEISQGWVTAHGGREMGFSLGTWASALAQAEEQRALVLRDPAGAPAAFLTFVPIFGQPGGWALDLMRRREQLHPLAMHYLLATALKTFQAEGASHVALGLSPLADVTPSEEPDTPELLARVRELVYTHFTRFYNFSGLHLFKNKFSPRWEPRYLIYPAVTQLPPILLALMKAHRG